MDADWSVEIGEGLPWIDVPWEGWVDLRDRSTAAERLGALPEVEAYPELAEVLLELNSRHSAAISSKCDVFPVDVASMPPGMLDESEAGSAEDVLSGLGSYIDLAFAIDESSFNFSWWESLARRVSSELLAPIPMPGASVELVIRQSSFFTVPSYGLTLYAMGFGRDPDAARQTWAKIMRFSAYITMDEVTSLVAARLNSNRQQPGE